MRSPFTWSFSLGSLFGISIRVHVLFPFIAAAFLLRAAFHPGREQAYPEGTVLDVMLLMLLLFISVLLHEWGHCLGARLVEGDAHEILLWPLGGLAPLEVPQRPKAQFLAAAAGPLTSLAIALVAGVGVLWFSNFEDRPPWSPLWPAFRTEDGGNVALAKLYQWNGDEDFIKEKKKEKKDTPDAKEKKDLPVLEEGEPNWALVLMARIYWLNWILFLANVGLWALPLDGGRMLQCVLWPWYGFRQATQWAIFSGFFVTVIVAIIGLAYNEIFVLFLAMILFITCQQQWILLETGGEESVFGYDFSQGYTSLENEPPPAPRRKRPNFWQRWRQNRAQRKIQREQEIREAEERRMDELLQKVQREGLPSLTEEERRFLKRVSDRYRHR